MIVELKKQIEQNIQRFSTGDLKDSSEILLNTLGYSSKKKAEIDLNSLKKRAIEKNVDSLSYAVWDEWVNASFIFQLSDEELQDQASLFEFRVLVEDLMQSYLFFAIDLKGKQYSRGQLSGITRFMNRLYDMPVMVIFRYNGLLTFAIINRRPNKNSSEKTVLEKITLIKDISIKLPHRAHVEILFDLSLNELRRNYEFYDFDGLHKAWQKTLDIKELNKQFYQKLFNWYLWALRYAKFPQIRPKEELIPDSIHQSESLIRLLTRLLFVWFMKEKGLITPDLFEEHKLKRILKNFKGLGGEETIFYKAILQNLFFATLNRKIEDRKPIEKGKYPNPEYGDPLVYRYEEFFLEPEKLLSYFKNIPFLNGGLFDCLDQKKDKDNPIEIRLDGFSSKKEKQPIMPDKLFFGEYQKVDLSKDYGDKKKSCVTVSGLIDILQHYKFTIEENTPIEEEVALDPELLGKVFENLLASYNPETQSTARKQTGSFYTPREIVDYMVDQSLIAYLRNIVDDEVRLRKLLSYEFYDGYNPFNKKETALLLTAIDSCKILDPACGSGAFPMGVLQKLIHILHKLDPDNSQWFEMVITNFPVYMQPEVRKKLEKENWNYIRKLGIIQQCIYGVDIQPIATQIAKLRFFISLLVDQKEKPGDENRGFEPLPNLDFKIVTADTLIPAPNSDEETSGLFSNQRDPFFDKFDKHTSLFFATSDPDEKKEVKTQIISLIESKCRQKINQIKSKYEHSDDKAKKVLKDRYRVFIEKQEREIMLWESYPNIFKYERVGFFDPVYFFPNLKNGFDIVIGNPPYIQLQKDGGKLADLYENYAFETFDRNGDIYELFYERGLKLTKQKGISTYITSSQWMKANYGKGLRNFFLKFNPLILIELGPGVFDNTIVDTNILIVQNNVNIKVLKGYKLKTADDLSSVIDLDPVTNLSDKAWNILNPIKQSINSKIHENGRPLREWDINIYFGIKTGLNEAFIIDREKEKQLRISDHNSSKIVRPVLRGRGIRKYLSVWDGDYLISTFPSLNINIDKYKSVKRHLECYLPKINQTGEEFINNLGQKEKTRKKTCNKWFETQDQIGFVKEFQREKLIWKRIGSQLRFSYSADEIFCLDSTCIATGEKIKYLTGILNSKLSNYYLFQNSPKTGMGDLIISVQALEPLPVYYPTDVEEKKVVNLVDRIIDVKRTNFTSDTSDLEAEIDTLVYKLYDLNEDEIKTIENELQKYKSNKASEEED